MPDSSYPEFNYQPLEKPSRPKLIKPDEPGDKRDKPDDLTNTTTRRTEGRNRAVGKPKALKESPKTITSIKATNDAANIGRVLAEVSLLMSATLVGGSAVYEGGKAVIPHNSNTADSQSVSASDQSDRKEAIAKGAHPQKYQNDGLTITVVEPSTSQPGKTNFEQRNDVESDLYKKFAAQRMMSWMNMDKLSSQDAQSLNQQIQQMKKVIEGNPSFDGMKKVIQTHTDDLIAFSLDPNKTPFGTDPSVKLSPIQPEVALSLSLIENGGAEHMTSSVGAADDMQVMPDVLAEGLTEINIKTEDFNKLGRDEQAKVRRFIGVRKIARDRDLFGDYGLAVWSYHAGPGNVYHALRLYFKDKTGKDYGDLDEKLGKKDIDIYSEYRDLIKNNNLNLFTLFQDAKVNDFLNSLSDETNLYTWKAIAANEIINRDLPTIIEQVRTRQTKKANDARVAAKIIQ